MGVYKKICLEMIEKVERLAAYNNIEGILAYIDDKRKQIKNIQSNENDESKYIDELIKDLK